MIFKRLKLYKVIFNNLYCNDFKYNDYNNLFYLIRQVAFVYWIIELCLGARHYLISILFLTRTSFVNRFVMIRLMCETILLLTLT